jgi:hypothetical protein
MQTTLRGVWLAVPQLGVNEGPDNNFGIVRENRSDTQEQSWQRLPGNGYLYNRAPRDSAHERSGDDNSGGSHGHDHLRDCRRHRRRHRRFGH